MRWIGSACAAAALALGVLASPAAAASSGSYLLTARSSHSSHYAPTFTGNGLLGIRVPATGEGYAGGSARPIRVGRASTPSRPRRRRCRSGCSSGPTSPTWSTLASPTTGRHIRRRRWLRLQAGSSRLISTPGSSPPRARWTAPDTTSPLSPTGCFTDRAREHVGLAHAELRPQWSGTGHRHRRDRRVPRHADQSGEQGMQRRPPPDHVEVAHPDHRDRCRHLQPPGLEPRRSAPRPPRSTDPPEPERRPAAHLPGHRRATYTFTKYVGVEDSQNATDPVACGAGDAARLRPSGLSSARSANRRAWAKLWRGRVDVSGNRTLATDVNASEFYLWSSTRDGVDWSISPAGLSSNGYDGHIFWDAETWMYPSLLAQHPDLAARDGRLPLPPAHAGPAARHRHRLPRSALPVGERPGRHRADTAAGVG